MGATQSAAPACSAASSDEPRPWPLAGCPQPFATSETSSTLLSVTLAPPGGRAGGGGERGGGDAGGPSVAATAALAAASPAACRPPAALEEDLHPLCGTDGDGGRKGGGCGSSASSSSSSDGSCIREGGSAARARLDDADSDACSDGGAGHAGHDEAAGHEPGREVLGRLEHAGAKTTVAKLRDAGELTWALQPPPATAAPHARGREGPQPRPLLCSPSFVLPCVLRDERSSARGAARSSLITTEWSLALLPAAGVGGGGGSGEGDKGSGAWRLGLVLRWLPGAATRAGGSARLAASGRVAVRSAGPAQRQAASAAAAGLEASADFSLSLANAGCPAELPLLLPAPATPDAPRAGSPHPPPAPATPPQPGGSGGAGCGTAAPAPCGALHALPQPLLVALMLESLELRLADGEGTAAKRNGGSAAAAAASDAAAPARLPPAGPTCGAAPPAPLPAPRRLQALLLSTAPRLLVVDGFLPAALCDGLRELAGDKLVRSRVASGSETPSRTSWSYFFVKDAARHPVVAEVEAHIAALFECPAVRGPMPRLAKVEALQVIKYHVGEFYREHYDNRADAPLTRAATVIIYLDDTDDGGATAFPRALVASGSGQPQRGPAALPRGVELSSDGRGVSVWPVKGRAIVFWSKRPNGDEDVSSIHCAEPVIAGDKWIATRWMRDDAPAQTPAA